ncbi:MAG: hypothetical protein M1831_002138 [Alyxoria varia]|nr:MAG: hypothetical protein M1831_002138 [Alyxoria varia]
MRNLLFEPSDAIEPQYSFYSYIRTECSYRTVLCSAHGGRSLDKGTRSPAQASKLQVAGELINNIFQAHALEKSALQTRKDVPSQPSAVTAEKHQTAAAEFAKATEGIGDYEALRVLRLLEEHHRKLAAIVKDAGNERKDRGVQSVEDGDQGRKDPADGGESLPRENNGLGRRKATEKKILGPQQETSEADASGAQNVHQDNAFSSDASTQKSTLPSKPSKQAPESLTSPRSRRTTQQTAPTNTKTSTSPNAQRKLVRESSSSIAGNLASARGIPTVQQKEARRALRQSQQVLGAGSRQDTSNKDVEKEKPVGSTGSPLSPNGKDELAQADQNDEKSDARPVEAPSKEAGDAEQQVASMPGSAPEMAEDPFNRFYTTFGGLMSKISAPLAFAGLPLTGDSEDPNPKFFTSSAPTTSRGATKQQHQPRTSTAPRHLTPENPTKRETEDSLLNKVYSKAALRALLSDDRGPSTQNMHESFYVVPHSGGTVSYANILSSHRRSDSHSDPATQQKREQDVAEHFVDARESQRRNSCIPATDSANAAQNKPLPTPTGGASNGPQAGTSTKTLEELTLENASLKQLTDNLSKRLYMWERDSQRQTEAMRASIRYMNMSSSQQQQQHQRAAGEGKFAGEGNSEGSPLGSPEQQEDSAGKEKSGDGQTERMKELEERVVKSEREMQRAVRENEKLKTVVGRYREKWEKLKEGARTRREGGGAVVDTGGRDVGRDTPDLSEDKAPTTTGKVVEDPGAQEKTRESDGLGVGTQGVLATDAAKSPGKPAAAAKAAPTVDDEHDEE